MKNHHEQSVMLNRGTILAIMVAGIVMLSGCAGWGSDGPEDDDDAEPAQADDLEDESNATDGDGDADSSDTDSGEDNSDSSDDTDDSTDTDDSSDDSGDDSSDGDTGATDGDSSDGDTDDGDAGDGANDGDSETDGDSGDGDGDAGDGDAGDGDDTNDGDGDGDASNGDGDSDAGDGDGDDQDDVAAALTVTVEDQAGNAVEGVEVVGIGPDADIFSAETNADGQAVYDGLPAGDYEFHVTTDGTDYEESSTESITLEEGDDESLTVTVTDSDTGTEPGASLTVNVEDQEGNAVEGIEVVGIGPEADIFSAETNADGQATYEGLPAGDYEYHATTDGTDYEESSTEAISLEDGDDESLTVTVTDEDAGDGDEENTATGKVIVRDQNGDPVEGEQVLLRPPGTVEDDAREERVTDENGEVVIELLAGEPEDVVNYGVEVRSEEKQLGIMSDEHSDPAVQTVEFEVSENSMYEFTRTIRVVDETGEPVEGELVEARNMGVSEFSEVGTTDENGEVTLTASSSDNGDAFMFDVRVAGTTVTGVAVDATDQERKVIEIGPQEPETVGDLTIVAVDEDTEEPVTEATVTATHLDSGDTFELPTNSDGEAVFENIQHGEYAVTVEADGWTTAEETVAFEGDTDEETDLRQTIHLSPEQSGDGTDESLTIVVEDEAGDPVAGEPVTITYEDGSTSERETNEDGEVVLEFDITDGSADNVTVNVAVSDENRDVIIHDGEELSETFTVSADDEGEGAAAASVTPPIIAA